MPRLFWTFPDGLPGAGLLLMRVVAAAALLHRAGAGWYEPSFGLPFALSAAEALSAISLLAGVGTPCGGAIAAAIELWRAYSNPGDLLVSGLLATLAGSLALLGAGAASVDSWIFGWQQIEVRDVRTPRGGAQSRAPRSKGFDRRHE